MTCWAKPHQPPPNNAISTVKPHSRAITPDQSLSAFAPLSPTTNTYNAPATTNTLGSFGATQKPSASPWPALSAQQQPTLPTRPPQQNQLSNSFSSFSIAPPPSVNNARPATMGNNSFSGLSDKPMQPAQNNFGLANGSVQPQFGSVLQPQPRQQQQQQQFPQPQVQPKKTGLDAYESLI